MTLIFYNCTADPRRVNKIPYMTNVWSHSVDPIEARDLLSPQFTIAYTSEMPSSINYAYCQELDKYYFVTTQVHKKAKTVTIYCNIDVRMTYLNKSTIDFPMTVTRNQYSNNSNIRDTSLPIDPSYHDFVVLPFETDLFISQGLRQSYEVLEITGGAQYVN